MPGEEYNEVLVFNDYAKLTGTRFSEHYRNKYGLPVTFENDVNAAVVGYYTLHEEEIEIYGSFISEKHLGNISSII